MEKEKKLNKKIIGVIALFLIMLSLTFGAYAIWNELTKTDDVIVPIGEETILTVDLATQTNKQLVPTGKVVWTATQTDLVVITYNIQLTGYVGSGNLILSANTSNILIDGSATYAGLVVVNTPVVTTVNGTQSTVTIHVSLINPSSLIEYNAIAGKNITFTLTFIAQPQA